MHEAQFFGMKRVARHDFEAIVNELLVFRESGAFQDDIAAVQGIVEQGMPDELRMGANLVGAPAPPRRVLPYCRRQTGSDGSVGHRVRTEQPA